MKRRNNREIWNRPEKEEYSTRLKINSTFIHARRSDRTPLKAVVRRSFHSLYTILWYTVKECSETTQKPRNEKKIGKGAVFHQVKNQLHLYTCRTFQKYSFKSSSSMPSPFFIHLSMIYYKRVQWNNAKTEKVEKDWKRSSIQPGLKPSHALYTQNIP